MPGCESTDAFVRCPLGPMSQVAKYEDELICDACRRYVDDPLRGETVKGSVASDSPPRPLAQTIAVESKQMENAFLRLFGYQPGLAIW